MTEQEARNIYHQGEEAVVAKFMEFDARLNPTSSSKSSKSPYPEALFDFLKNYLHHIFQF